MRRRRFATSHKALPLPSRGCTASRNPGEGAVASALAWASVRECHLTAAEFSTSNVGQLFMYFSLGAQSCPEEG
jgi:hypothetical protein